MNQPDGNRVAGPQVRLRRQTEIWSNNRRLLEAAEHFGIRGRSV